MILVDKSAWIGRLIGSPTSETPWGLVPEQADWLVPTMVQLELARWASRAAEDMEDLAHRSIPA